MYTRMNRCRCDKRLSGALSSRLRRRQPQLSMDQRQELLGDYGWPCSTCDRIRVTSSMPGIFDKAESTIIHWQACSATRTRYQLRRLFADHDTGSIRVSIDNRGHDGGIRDSQTLNSMHAKLWVDDGRDMLPHLARADRVVQRCCRLPNRCFNLTRRGCPGKWCQLLNRQFRECGRTSHLPRKPNTFAEDAQIAIAL
jgi:hypothetical protein